MYQDKFYKVGLMFIDKRVMLCDDGPGVIDFGPVSEWCQMYASYISMTLKVGKDRNEKKNRSGLLNAGRQHQALLRAVDRWDFG